FGMNWSEYSRFVGDIFGAPLAIEALLAFFLESIFLGVWVFGWDRLPRGLHLAAIWLVALGANISAFWILVANSFMQHPVGFDLTGTRMVMNQFSALLTNPYVWGQFPHTVFSGFTTGAFFVLGISAYHLIRRQKVDVFRPSFAIASVFGTIAVVMVILIGHNQGQRMVQFQPMKMAAAEALWESEDPASFSLISIVDQESKEDIFSIRIPRLLSVMAYNRLDGEVKGINDLQREYEQKFGPGEYVPNITITYWSFRAMVGAGFLMLALALYCLYRVMRGQSLQKFRFLGALPFAIALPYLANSTGWLLTEMGRQPWVVYGFLKTENAASPSVTAGMVLTSLIVFTLVYAILIVADVYLLRKFARQGPEEAAGANGKVIEAQEEFELVV
ncbi:MAG TPA: cytochrome ubiquinol oxidase subunit I, partial [Anaerolineaceae bacterium]|nr:cytochrome ubiquinol oxidase subunit I [Anaerolineaceae bacterium]